MHLDGVFAAGDRLSGHPDSGDMQDGHRRLRVRRIDVDVPLGAVLLGSAAECRVLGDLHR
jgi:hypothetical protein